MSPALRFIGPPKVAVDELAGAVLAEVHASLANDDLRLDQPPALGAEAAGRAEESVVAEVHGEAPCAWLPGRQSNTRIAGAGGSAPLLPLGKAHHKPKNIPGRRQCRQPRQQQK